MQGQHKKKQGHFALNVMLKNLFQLSDCYCDVLVKLMQQIKKYFFWKV